jgi:hypothetical protein
MSTVPATNANTGITDLMQILSSSAPPALTSFMSSSTMRSALGKESPEDLVQLSDQAVHLQEVSGLFGGAPVPTATESAGMAMQNLLTSIYSPGSNVNLLA